MHPNYSESDAPYILFARFASIPFYLRHNRRQNIIYKNVSNLFV